MMVNFFRKKSKLSQPIPEPVIDKVCEEYYKRMDSIDKTFPYFLKVLEQKTREYFSEKNQLEGKINKNQPLILEEILKKIQGRVA